MLVANPMTVVPAANTAAAPITHFSTTFNLSLNSSCFSYNLSIFNCITVILVSCEASSPKSVIWPPSIIHEYVVYANTYSR